MRRSMGASRREIRSMELLPDTRAGLLHAGQEPREAAIEDLLHVDVTQLAVEAAEEPLGLRTIGIVIAAGNLVQRLAAAGHAEAEGAGEIGVEDEVADHALG